MSGFVISLRRSLVGMIMLAMLLALVGTFLLAPHQANAASCGSSATIPAWTADGTQVVGGHITVSCERSDGPFIYVTSSLKYTSFIDVYFRASNNSILGFREAPGVSSLFSYSVVGGTSYQACAEVSGATASGQAANGHICY